MRWLLSWLVSVAVGIGGTGCSKASGSAVDPPASARLAAPSSESVASPASTAGAASSPARLPTAPPPVLVDAACGMKPNGCILRDWMKGNTAPAIVAGDLDALQAALDEAATFAPPPPGYPNWASIARDGADAARMQDLEAVKAACRSCHAQYRDRYRRDLHDRRL